MKIINNISIDEHTFGSLKSGDVFLYEGDPFLKISNTIKDISFRAFNLSKGYKTDFKDYTVVTPLPNAYLTLE